MVRAPVVGIVVVAAVSALAAVLGPRNAGAARAGGVPSLPRERLSPRVRALLHTRMVGHGEDASAVVAGAIALDHLAVSAAAARILAEPWFARPVGAVPDALNAELPSRFFVLQDALRARARAVEQASRAGDDHALATAVGALASACVECHATYRAPSGGAGTPER